MPQMVAQTSFLSKDQAARVIAFTQQQHEKVQVEPFRDNQEHLEALEREARLMLGLALLRHTEWHGKVDYVRSTFLQLPTEEATWSNIEESLRLEMMHNRAREEVSARLAKELLFCRLCAEYGLEEFDRATVLLLFMLKTSRSFLEMFLHCGFEKEQSERGGMKIGSLLSILCKDYREELEKRCRFRVDAPLIHHEIIMINECIEDDANILDEKVKLNGRFERFILGDDSLYSSDFRVIRRERANVKLEQVIMPEELKNEIITHVGNYIDQRRAGSTGTGLDDFFGYGTALTFLFYGPSGTGKTMLASGLAHHFDHQLFSLKVDDMSDVSRPDDEILAVLFREASLRKGIVLLDESDDLFRPNSGASRSLLIEIEKARCIVILATNRPVELDPAMERRITMKVHFPLPDAILRQRIWQALLPENVRLAPDVDLKEIAERFPFTGGLIKNTLFMAINRISEPSQNGALKLTRMDLQKAAELQASSLSEVTGLERSYIPTRTLAGLPLQRRQKLELGNAAQAFRRLKKEGLGLNILICCSDISTGVNAAEAMAAACELRVREFDCFKVMSMKNEDREFHPLTHRLVSPFVYALSPRAGVSCLTLFVDHTGNTIRESDRNANSGNSLFLTELSCHLRTHSGFFCLVTKDLKSGYIPSVFHLRFDLEHPPEEDQIQRWERHLGKTNIPVDLLISLVERYPMHLGEIDFIARRAHVHSIILERKNGPTMADLQEVISSYQPKPVAPALFGADMPLAAAAPKS